ncbi:hypothetical protein DFH28DRAFT_886219 [Melampsora americana]|nr:hypothetical protein DFH28DRAFT_886219 [Melampsora americana]
MNCRPYQRMLVKLLYFLLIWNYHSLSQHMKEKSSLLAQGLYVIEEVTEDVELGSPDVTELQRHNSLSSSQQLNINGLIFGDSYSNTGRSANERHTLKFLFEQQDRENAEQERIQQERKATEKIYTKLMNPSQLLSPRTYDLPSPRKMHTKKLKLSQIDKLAPHELIDYISQFNLQVKMRKDRWIKAEDTETFCEESLYQPAVTKFLLKIKKEDRSIALKQKLQQLRDTIKSTSLANLDEKKLNQLVLRNFIKDQGISLDEVDQAHNYAQSLQQDALWEAKKHISSGMKLFDRIKLSIKRFFKFNFKWPWTKKAHPI